MAFTLGLRTATTYIDHTYKQTSCWMEEAGQQYQCTAEGICNMEHMVELFLKLLPKPIIFLRPRSDHVNPQQTPVALSVMISRIKHELLCVACFAWPLPPFPVFLQFIPFLTFCDPFILAHLLFCTGHSYLPSLCRVLAGTNYLLTSWNPWLPSRLGSGLGATLYMKPFLTLPAAGTLPSITTLHSFSIHYV